MTSRKRSFRAYPLIAFFTLLVLVLSACGSTDSSGSKGSITVGGKLDVEAQLLTELNTLLLRKNGFTVNEK
ncbi:MAG TPA: glycine/betaine ABC transporter substrate-binding protein, partial [Ktedonobacteraceae bacterium]|nr:glycine/betaine ABC transporter substrate-binding protein [Ktedonobacteraceae bacterium]